MLRGEAAARALDAAAAWAAVSGQWPVPWPRWPTPASRLEAGAVMLRHVRLAYGAAPAHACARVWCPRGHTYADP